ncbi:MAG: hypothetical protein ACYSTX_02065 [Planctomycetota bacterium]|jgi:hypothetical protein
MIVPTRNTKVFISALLSILAGLVILQSLGTAPPKADAFSLSDFYELEPVDEAVASSTQQYRDRWSRINILFSGTKAGDIDQLSSLSGLTKTEDMNFHFVVCNGFGGADGLIQSTEKWQRQWSTTPDLNTSAGERIIRICVVSDAKKTFPTELQIIRTEQLVEALSRKFRIRPEAITYPENW